MVFDTDSDSDPDLDLKLAGGFSVQGQVSGENRSGVEVVADKAFDPAKEPNRNVILYGNADTNALWPKLLANCPVEIRNGHARIGDHEFPGNDLGAYFVRPRPDSATASVGAISWTGPAGWVAAGPVQYFVSGAGFPDLILFSAGMLRTGTGGVHAVGWFGNDWSLDRGDFIWNPIR